MMAQYRGTTLYHHHHHSVECKPNRCGIAPYHAHVGIDFEDASQSDIQALQHLISRREVGPAVQNQDFDIVGF